MTAGTVLVTYGGFAAEHPECGGALRDAGLELRVHPRTADRSPDELAELLGDAVAAIADADPFDASVIARAPGLRVVARTGVGLDSIDLEAATSAGVVVTITPGVNNETVADHTLALMLAAVRYLPTQDAALRAGGWRDFGIHLGQLHAATVGLVGYGAIGRAVARRVRAFGAELVVHDPLSDVDDAPALELEDLLGCSDVVSLHLPLTAQTAGLLDRDRFARMKTGAVLVNTSRGPIVDEPALVEALTSGPLIAAGIDVFEVEPPGGRPLTRLPNVILSPHCAGISDASNLAMSRMATRSVLAALAGEHVDHVANARVG